MGNLAEWSLTFSQVQRDFLCVQKSSHLFNRIFNCRPLQKSAEFGCCLCPHLAPLTHFRGVLTFQDTCLASVRLPICSQLTQPSHFDEATLFRMASCPPNCITFYMLCPGIPLLAKGCQNLIRHIRGALLTPDPWLVCVDKVAPHTQRRAH